MHTLCNKFVESLIPMHHCNIDMKRTNKQNSHTNTLNNVPLAAIIARTEIYYIHYTRI